ncbi:unnamed protein product [Prorocentrum cordatum]|uniref:Kinesin motor domain-containing protein n=1 Tax=Prorocentrum cordatum TaxID=2364126 RepID=A0ABN9U4N1_9DINO|nr:unnamed protein product [Polarella glacialis]
MASAPAVKLQKATQKGLAQRALADTAKDASSSSIKVCVRVRPFIKEEISGDRSGGMCVCCIEMPTTTTTIMRKGETAREFEYDRCYWSHTKDHPLYATQQTLHDELGVTMLSHAFDGYNNCVFAYGQTGSGKSYSVVGSAGDDRGLLPRIVEGLFQKSAAMSKDSKMKMVVSVMEIYNEEIRDLLNIQAVSASQKKLDVRLHPTLGVTIPGLTEHPLDSCANVITIVHAGLDNRKVGSTAMNASSSRSHCIFTFKTSFVEPDGNTKSSQTHLVDLAGSERASRTGAEGDRLKEGAAINKALSTLARVIYKELAKAGVRKNPPFRDSKLTHVLKEALAGNSKTVMVAAISPSAVDYDETLSTMQFCRQVKMVQTKAVANTSNEKGIEAELRREAEMLRSKLAIAEANAGAGGGDPSSTGSAHVDEVLSKYGRGKVDLLVQKLEQTEQLSKFYGASYDEWLAEEKRKIQKSATVDPDQIERFRQQQANREDDGSASEHEDSDASADTAKDEFVLCNCLTREAAISDTIETFARGDDETNRISVTGPIARELLSALGGSRALPGEEEDEEVDDPQDLMDRAAAHKTKALAQCWRSCVEVESLALRVSRPGAPKLVLIPHVAIRPDEIDLTCEVIVSAEYNDDGEVIRELFHRAQLELLLKFLQDEAAGLNEGEHGTYDNAWEIAVARVTGRATRAEVKKMQADLSTAPRPSDVGRLGQTTEELRLELAQQQSATGRIESEASDTRAAHARLVSEESKELQRECNMVRRLESMAESQTVELEMQQFQLEAARREGAAASRLRAEAQALRSELGSAELRRSAARRGSEDAHASGDSLRSELGVLQRELSAMRRAAEEARVAEGQQAERELRMLQQQSGDAQRLRGELDQARAQLAAALSAVEVIDAQEPDADAAELVRRLQREGAALRKRCGEALSEAGALRSELGELQRELSDAQAAECQQAEQELRMLQCQSDETRSRRCSGSWQRPGSA